jgi:branched-chain amino acid transport system ATP-binding protein
MTMAGDDEGPTLSADAVARAAADLEAGGPDRETLRALAGGDPMIAVTDLRAGYGRMEILHGLDLFAAAGKALCLIGPNGAGKSTVLHAIFGFADRFGGRIAVAGEDVTALSSKDKLRRAGIAYILQDNSVFPEMTVEENLLMGGFLKNRPAEARASAERVFEKYGRLAERRHQKAGVLSGGERRLLEISRALIMEPKILLVDEPSIGLEPRFIEKVFEILDDLKSNEGKTIVLVEQNAKKGLEFADIGYVLVSGRVVMADTGAALLRNPEVGRLFLGG